MKWREYMFRSITFLRRSNWGYGSFSFGLTGGLYLVLVKKNRIIANNIFFGYVVTYFTAGKHNQ
jgi:hypothetical protein